MATREEIEARIKATRRRRIIEFVNDYKKTHKTTQAKAAEQLGIQPGFISQLKMQNHRGIGEGLARFMEQEAGLPMFWFVDILPRHK